MKIKYIYDSVLHSRIKFTLVPDAHSFGFSCRCLSAVFISYFDFDFHFTWETLSSSGINGGLSLSQLACF